MIVCEICGKKFKNAQGLRGHKTFVHGITGGKIPKTPAIAPTNEPQLSSLEERLKRLELISISKDSLPDVITGAVEPLNQKLNNTTEQLAKISDTVSILNRDIRQNNAVADAQRKDFTQLLSKLQADQSELVTDLNEQRDAFRKNLASLESRIDQTQKLVEIPGDTEPLTQKFINTSTQLNKLKDSVSILSQDIRRSDNSSETQKKEFHQLLTNMQEAHNRLATLINEHRYSVNKNLEGLELRIENTQKMVEIPGDSEPLTQKFINTTEQLGKINDMVNRLGQDIRSNDAAIGATRTEINDRLSNTAKQLTRVSDVVNRLEFVTGLKDSGTDEMPERIEPLTQKLSNTTGQLVKLGDTVNRLSQDIKLSNTATDAQKKEFGQLLANLQEAHDRLTDTTTEHLETLKRKLENVESLAENTQKLMEIPGDSEPLTQKLINTAKELNKLTEITGKLQYVTGLKDAAANGVPIDPAPLSQRLNNTTEQLNKLEDTLNRLGQDVRLNETTTNAQRKEFSQLLNNLQEAHTRITAEMNGRDDTFDKNLEVLESRIEKTQRMIEIPGDSEPLTQKLINTAGQLNKLSDRLDKLDFITGLKDSDSTEIGSTEPLMQKLNNTAGQLNRLSDTVNKLMQDAKLTNTATDVQKKETSQLLSNLQEDQNQLAAITSERHESFNKNLEALESRIENTEKIVETKGDTEPLNQKINNISGQLAALNDIVSSLSQEIRLSNAATDAQKKEFSSKLDSASKELDKLRETVSKLEFITGVGNYDSADLNGVIEPLSQRLNNTNEQLNRFTRRLDKLDFVTGLRETGPDDIPESVMPLTQKLNDTTAQLAGINEIVVTLSQDFKLNETATDTQKKEFGQLLTNLQEAHNRLATVINEHYYAFNKNFEVLESRIDKTQKMVEIPGETEPLTQKFINTTEQLNKLNDTVNKLSTSISLNSAITDGQRNEFNEKLNSTAGELMKIGGTVNKLASITGLGDSDSTEIPGKSEPFTRQLNNITEQLNKLTITVNKLSQEISLNDAITDGQRKEFNNKLNNTSEELFIINGTVKKLVSVTGLVDSDSTDILGGAEPLTQKVNNITEQLAKISDLIGRLNQDMKLNETATDTQKEEFNQLLANLQKTDDRLTAIINEHREAVNQNLEVLESRIDETQEMVEIPGDSEPLTQKLINTTEQLAKLTNRLDKLDFITGLKDSDSTDTQGNTEPLTKKLSNTTEQLAKIGDIINKLNQDVRLIGHTTDAQRKEISNRLTYTSEELIKMSAVVSRLEFIVGPRDTDSTDTPGDSESVIRKLNKANEQMVKLNDIVGKLKFVTGLKDPGPDDTPESSVPLSQKLNNTTEQLNKLNEMVGRLEYVTGLNDSSPDNIPEGAEPLTQRLIKTTGQLNKLTEMVGRLSQDMRLTDTTTDAQRKEFSNKLSNTAEQLNKLTGRLDKLDFITGLKESAPNGIPEGTAPLTLKLSNTVEQLNKLNEIVNKLSQELSMSNVLTDGQRKGFSNKLNITNEQLAKLSDTVNKMNQDIKLSETTTETQKKEMNHLLTGLQEAQNRLAAVIDEHHSTFTKNLDILESRIENTQKMVEIPGDTEPMTLKLTNTTAQLAKLSDTVSRLEFIIGIKDPGPGIPIDTEPLTQKINNTSEQLNKLTEMVGKLSQDVRGSETITEAQRNEFSDRLNNTTEQMIKLNDIVGKLSQDIGQSATATEAQKKEFSQSLTSLQESQSRLAAIIDEHRDAMKKNLDIMESRLQDTQKMVEGFNEAQNENKPKPAPDGLESLRLIPQLKIELERTGEQIASLQAGVAKAQALAVRTSTDELVTINMASGAKHVFRVYRGKRGLSKPHRIGIDPVYGEKYVDLSEPED